MRTVYIALVGFLLGVSGFFTFVVPEAAFAVLPGPQVGPLLSAVFPRFYLWTAAAAALSILVLLWGGRRSLRELLAPIAALVITLVAWLWLLPAVNAAEGTPSFGALHGISLGLDLVTMVLWLLALLAAGRNWPARR